MLLVGIDLGTSACKATVFRQDGTAVGRGWSSYATARGPDGAAEVWPDDWWRAASLAVRQAVDAAGCTGRDVGAIGLSGQIGNQVLLDDKGKPVRPAIIWQDLRAAAEAQELAQSHGREQLFEWLAIDLPAGANWPAPRLLWLSRHDPAAFARARRLLQAKDYLIYLATGELVSDASSWRGLINQATGQPARPLLDRLGVDPAVLPTVQPPTSLAGRLTTEAAATLGLSPGTPVAVGWNDLNCAILGSGAIGAGEAFSVGGTSEHLGVTLPPSPLSLAPQGLMRAPYLDGPVVYGVTSAGGGSLAWYGDIAGDISAVLAAAEAAPAGSDGLIYLPYLNGERAPIWDSAARGVFFGLSSSHGRAHLARAVLEGVAYSLGQVLTAVEAAAGPINAVRISGGPARSPLWNRVKASVWNLPILVTGEPDAASLGAAMLAACAVGLYAGPAEAAAGMTRLAATVEPDPAWHAVYDRLQQLFQSLYPTLQSSFHFLQQARDGRQDS